MTSIKKIRVLIVDDSTIIQKLFSSILSYDHNIEVVGVAGGAYEARDLIKQHNPDVLLLDVVMPGMDGITFLKKIMQLHPMPVVIISAYTEADKNIALDALALGAVDCIPKPTSAELADIEKYALGFCDRIKNAALANIHALTPFKNSPAIFTSDYEKINKSSTSSELFLKNTIIGIGASTGGIEAIERILSQLPQQFPALLIVQHISRDFDEIFVQRINRLSKLNVQSAVDGQPILPGQALIAPGNYHLTITKKANRYVCHLDNRKAMQMHKPSIDVLFHSLAEVAASHATGILLTGMGTDGALGLKAIADAGGTTIAQNQESSVVWGMPGAAVKLGAAQYVFSLEDIVNYLKNISLKNR